MFVVNDVVFHQHEPIPAPFRMMMMMFYQAVIGACTINAACACAHCVFTFVKPSLENGLIVGHLISSFVQWWLA